MIDPELDARLKKINGEAWIRFVVMMLFVWVLCMILLAQRAHAASTPKPTPAVTSMLCVNKVTSGIRDILTTNKTGQCRSNEIPISAQALIVQPSPSPAASSSPIQGDPSPTASADPTATATPPANSDGSTVIDSQGNVVGANFIDDMGLVLRQINGIWMALAYNTNGFFDQSSDPGASPLTLFYTNTTCSGTGFVGLLGGSQVDDGPPAEQTGNSGSDNNGVYVYNGVVYYAAAPYSTINAVASQSFADPTKASLSGCQVFPSSAEVWLGGSEATFNLSTLDLTPPFSVQ